jgi:hypothetical protein
MPEPVRSLTLKVDGASVTVPAGTTVAAAIAIAGAPARVSVTGQPRGPLCGMGICFECRATIEGVPHQRSCQVLCSDGMDVRTK